MTNAGKFLDLQKLIAKTKQLCLHFDHVGATLSFASIVLNTGNFKNCCTWQMSLAIKLHLHCQVQGFGA